MEISVIEFVILAASSLGCIGSAVGIMLLTRKLPDERRDSNA
jgi:hypothetical protein